MPDREPQDPQYRVIREIQTAEGAECLVIEADPDLAQALGLKTTTGIVGKNPQERCLIIFLNEGDDNVPDTTVIAEGAVDKVEGGGLVLREGMLFIDWHAHQETGEFPSQVMAIRTARIIPKRGQTNDAGQIKVRVKAETVETEDGQILNQIHVFEGEEVEVQPYNMAGQPQTKITLQAGEQIQLDQEGQRVKMYSFNNDKHVIASLSTESAAGTPEMSCEIAHAPLGGRNVDLANIGIDPLVPVLVLAGLHQVPRRAIGKIVDAVVELIKAIINAPIEGLRDKIKRQLEAQLHDED